jgi:hypothetical protein
MRTEYEPKRWNGNTDPLDSNIPIEASGENAMKFHPYGGM